MKKLLILIICIAMLASFAGCKNTDSASDAPEVCEEKTQEAAKTQETATQAPAEPVEIRFSWWGSEVRHEATLSAIELYEEQNPNVDVVEEYSGYDGYQDKLMAQIAGNNAPDIFTCVTEWLPSLNASDGLYDMKGKLDVSGHSDKIVQASSIDGKLVGVNVSLNCKAVIYNKTYLDELGLSAPEGDYRIADMFDLWQDIYTKSEGETYGIYDPRLTDFYMPIYGYTELSKPEPFPYSNTDLTVTAEDITAWLTAFDGLPEGSLMPAAEAVVVDDFVSSPVSNRTAMFMFVNAGSFSLYQSQTEDDLEMLPLPVGPKGERAYQARPGLLLSVFSNSKEPEAAIAFLDYFSNSPDAAKILKTTRGVLPTQVQRDALLESPDLVTEMDKKIIKTVGDAFSGETKIFLAGPVNVNEVTTSLLDNVAQSYVFGQISAEDAGTKFMKEAQKILDAAN